MASFNHQTGYLTRVSIPLHLKANWKRKQEASTAQRQTAWKKKNNNKKQADETKEKIVWSATPKGNMDHKTQLRNQFSYKTAPQGTFFWWAESDGNHQALTLQGSHSAPVLAMLWWGLLRPKFGAWAYDIQQYWSRSLETWFIHYPSWRYLDSQNIFLLLLLLLKHTEHNIGATEHFQAQTNPKRLFRSQFPAA